MKNIFLNKKWKKNIAVFILLFLFIAKNEVNAQSQFSFVPGIYLNSNGFKENVQGFGAILGLEYLPNKDHFFSVELRTRYASYSFDGGTHWSDDWRGDLDPPKTYDKDMLEYSLFSPQIGVVPKFRYQLDDDIFLFLENELAVGLMTGSFKYDSRSGTKKFTETTFTYNIGVGVEFRKEKWSYAGSLGYSSLNFRESINKHRPPNSDGLIPNQDAVFILNIIFKVPL